MKRHALCTFGLAVIAAGCADVSPAPTEVAITPQVSLVIAAASAAAVNFENPPYTVGTIHLQDGWTSAGAAGLGCAIYDHAVAMNSAAVPSFGAQSLRMSNAVTSGCFSDQTFSKQVPIGAGETTAQDITGSTSSARQTSFEAEWNFASTVPGSEQAGLSVVASPDRGDGARMSWIQMRDTPSGLEVNFFDYRAGSGFVRTTVASGLSRSIPHTIKVVMDFVEGPENDIVKVSVDGVLLHTGTSWEEYFRIVELKPTRTVNRVLFRTGGTAAPATAGKGFLIDNLSLATFATPLSSAEQCKNDGWRSFNNPAFKNQGDCIQYVNTGR